MARDRTLRSDQRSSHFRKGDIFIHGIMPRSGTNFLMDVIALHQEVTACPKRIWEFPHLTHAGLFSTYNRAMARCPKLLDLKDGELLPYLGNALLWYAADGLPNGKRVLFKQPSVFNLPMFFEFFPESYLIILIRDGRDIACSSLKTKFASPANVVWNKPGTYRFLFSNPLKALAESWNEASRIVVDFLGCVKNMPFRENILVIRYEDLVSETRQRALEILQFLGLDADVYNWEGLDDMRVRGSSFVNNREGLLDWSRSEVKTSELNSIGRWHAWGEKEKKTFLFVAEKSLRTWGYL